jgi:hypothetical protein
MRIINRYFKILKIKSLACLDASAASAVCKIAVVRKVMSEIIRMGNLFMSRMLSKIDRLKN